MLGRGMKEGVLERWYGSSITNGLDGMVVKARM